MHVFSDLMPYICTFDGCQHKLRCFPSRSTWADHEFQEHRFDRYWACPECPARSCSTLDWEHHLNDAHNRKFSGPNLLSAKNTACRISRKRAEEEQCLLCRVVLGKPRRAFVKHVCRHMEDIALMALPSNAEENSEIGSISTDPDSNENNNTSKDLHIDEEYTIKCICGLKDDDGNTVYCEQCDTWQHTECYYLDENGIVPNMDVLSSIDHFCAECKPRPLNATGAMRRAEIGPHSPLLQQHSNALPKSFYTPKRGLKWGMSSKDHQYGPPSNESTEAPHLENLNTIDPFIDGMPVDWESQVLGPQEPAKETKRRERHLSPSRLRENLTPDGREHAKDVRKVRACNNCRRREIKVSVLAGCGVQYCG